MIGKSRIERGLVYPPQKYRTSQELLPDKQNGVRIEVDSQCPSGDAAHHYFYREYKISANGHCVVAQILYCRNCSHTLVTQFENPIGLEEFTPEHLETLLTTVYTSETGCKTNHDFCDTGHQRLPNGAIYGIHKRCKKCGNSALFPLVSLDLLPPEALEESEPKKLLRPTITPDCKEGGKHTYVKLKGYQRNTFGRIIGVYLACGTCGGIKYRSFQRKIANE